MQQPTWRRYLTDYNEGLGLVYERFVLNDFLDRLAAEYRISSVLEAPLYGMAGVSGINSVAFAQRGIGVTLVDDTPERLQGVQRIWEEDLRLPVNLAAVSPQAWGSLPFASRSFDLAWHWAGLWYIARPERLLRELTRVSRNLVFVAMPNRLQVGYWMRKLVIDRPFFLAHDESWTEMDRIRQLLEAQGVEIVEQGVLDVPPWPDTVMPANEVLKRLGIRSAALEQQFTGEGWQWNTMSYYMGKEPELHDRVTRYAWLDRARLPWQIKAVWAHHRYLVGRVNQEEENELGMIELETAIQRFTHNAAAIVSLCRGVADVQARWKPNLESWSLLEVINHLHDEERWDFRLRLDLTLFRPEIEWPPIDPVGWVMERQYNTRDLNESILEFQDERAKSLEWLHDLRTPNWSSSHTFSQGGVISAGQLLASWLAHDQLHIRQMVELHYAWLGHQSSADGLSYAGPW